MAKTSAALSVIPGSAGSPAAPDADLVDAVQHYIEAKIAPLRERLLVQDAEIKALKARPEPQIDLVIDRAGVLVYTKPDGTVREAGIVVGPPGRDGASLDDIDAVLAPIREQLVELAARPESQPGRDGLPGVPGPAGRDGLPGKDGVDGLGFDDIQVLYDGQRKFTFKIARGERVREFAFVVPLAIYREVFKEGTLYVTGDLVSFGGSIWHAMEPTTEKPGTGSKKWRLACKHGRDGHDGAKGDKGEKGDPGRPGRDLTHLTAGGT
jgi:hypothetical protein